ncbi:MAG: GAF domain-containing protein [Deltaproteobacteria bacterium]|nr:GAF domain-containing protein [Deltaproteobacteria bacterium]
MMGKLTYEYLERRVQELERLTGQLIDTAMDQEHHELFDLAVICNISQALASTIDLDQLLLIVIDEVNKALLTEGSGVLLYDESRGDLYWRQVRDARKILAPQTEALRVPMDGSIAGWVFQNNKSAIVNDSSKDPRYYPGISEKSGFQIHKVLQVPLRTPEKTIGVLMAMNKIGGDFTEQDEALLSSMAGSVALAVENATFYKKLKQSKDALEMLYRSSLALGTTMDLDHLLEVIISDLRSAMETEAGGVLLYDERRDDLYWREAQDSQGLINPAGVDLRLPIQGSISGQVFQSGEPVLINDPNANPLFFKTFEKRTGFVIRNEIIVPLNTREKTIGCLMVMNKKDGRFSQDDVQLLSSLAGVVALAVENATFFEELMGSYRDLENMNRVKSKVLNHLSHELRTPLAIIRGSLINMEKKFLEKGISDFDNALARINRHLQSLSRLETQVESIVMTGYSWEKRYITGFLQSALDLMDVQSEWTPEIKNAAAMIHKWLEKTFPTRHDRLDLIDTEQFGMSISKFIQAKTDEQERKLSLNFDMESAKLLIPTHVLQAIMEGLIRNAIEATPDGGRVDITGRTKGDRYIFKVKDTGVGIPDKDKELIFEGFYPVQDTENYSSRRPYSFNAGGKGIDLLRIRMFSELYGFRLSFSSKRCPYLTEKGIESSDVPESCSNCIQRTDCPENGGSEFVVDFALADANNIEQKTA